MSVLHWRLTIVEVMSGRLELPEASSLFEWLNSLKMRLDEANDASFVLWSAMAVSDCCHSWLTISSCFTAENSNLRYGDVKDILDSVYRHRLEVPRGAFIFLIATCSE